MRDYASILPTASHAYNFQANAYNFTDNTVMANNAASQANVAVDPTLQVSLLQAQQYVCTEYYEEGFHASNTSMCVFAQ